MAIQILDTKNKKVGEIELSDNISEKVNKAVLYYAVKADLNGRHHGTSSAKPRGEINKSKKKIYRQKGTGRARHAQRSANIFVGGGVVHGPQPRSFSEKVNKKFKSVGYREALRYLIQNDALKVLKELEFDKPSTREASAILNNLAAKKTLVILSKDNANAQLSFRNLKDVKVLNENNLNISDLLRYESVLVTAPYFESLKERFSL